MTTIVHLIAELPPSIRVGPFDIRIEIWDAVQSLAAHRYGEFSAIEERISVQREQRSAVGFVDTFMHEITHAVFWACNIKDDDNEERTVERLSTGMVQVFRDNQWLLPWLAKALR